MAPDAAGLTARMNRFMRTFTALLLICLGMFTSSGIAGDLTLDDVMYSDPPLDLPGVPLSFDPRLKGLWELALRRPESELQRLAADTIAIARGQGMRDLESTSDELAKIVQSPETPASVRRAAVNAIVALEAKQFSPVLIEAAKAHGLELQMVIEPALARWGNNALQETWQQRLNSEQTPALLRSMAIDGLGLLRVKGPKAKLLSLVLDPLVPMHHRIAAARSIARIGDGGVLDEAQRLLNDKAPAAIPNRLLGVYLLSSHQDEPARLKLVELAADTEPAIAGAALGRLFELDPQRVIPLAAAAIKNGDVNIRRIGAQALVLRGDLATIDEIAPLLDDPNPSLRAYVTKSLFDMSQKAELRPAVESRGQKTLSTEGWRGLEQACILLGYLQFKPSAPELMKLLKHRRHEVAVSSAWALSKLKVPETYPELLAHATTQHGRYVDPQTIGHERYLIGSQLNKLFQLFGEVRYREADPLLRLYVPKAIDLGDVRTAACWALGKIHEGEMATDLANQFEERILDIGSMPPELEPVRTMCAIGLGRFKAESGLSSLRQFANEGSRLALACWWSIQRITGEKPPERIVAKSYITGWFLQPLDR
jgi:HEAT repeat protein